VAWTAPITWTNAVLTAAQLNQQVRDNLLETAVAKATTANQYPVATGANALAMRRVDSDSALATQNTTSTSYTTASGPTVTITTGTTAIITLSAYFTIDTNSASAFYSVAVSGATTSASDDSRALTMGRYTAQVLIGATQTVYLTGLTAGSNTFTGQIRVTAGTGTFDNRRLVVMPF
jgi:hypothetical protein